MTLGPKEENVVPLAAVYLLLISSSPVEVLVMVGSGMACVLIARRGWRFAQGRKKAPEDRPS
jgi:hypothetical protein